jgi:hypothetical protein
MIGRKPWSRRVVASVRGKFRPFAIAPWPKAGTVGPVDSHQRAIPVPSLLEAGAHDEAINLRSSFWLNGKTLGKITLSLSAEKYYTPLIFKYLADGH